MVIRNNFNYRFFYANRNAFSKKGRISLYLRKNIIPLQSFCGKAEIAQLVEHNLAKVGVAGPSPVFRSSLKLCACPGGGIGRRARFRCVCFTTCRFESCSGHIPF